MSTMVNIHGRPQKLTQKSVYLSGPMRHHQIRHSMALMSWSDLCVPLAKFAYGFREADLL